MKCFYDCETTGKADFNAPPTAAHQPRLVQLAAVLATDEGEEISTINLLVKPDGWTIGPEAAAVHGITTEHATKYGIAAKAAVGIFVRMAQAADSLHAFNADFDRLILMIEIVRIPGMPDPFEAGKLRCEMKPMTDICRLPGNYGKFKWPSLVQAHTHCYGRAFDDAHDALGDVRAMMAVHKWRMATPENRELIKAAILPPA